MEELLKKLKEYLRTHPCLDYSAKLLMEETIKFMEQRLEGDPDSSEDGE